MGNPGEHKLIAGNLSLDFVNTINGHKETTFNEYLKNYRDFMIWSSRYGSITSNKSRLLKDKITQPAEDSSKVYIKVIEFRESLFDLFYSIVHKKSPSKNVLKKIVAIQKKGALASELIKKENRFKWTWDSDKSFESIIWPIAFSATKLLTSTDLEKIRICDGMVCDWFFLDKSRNQKRRWCSMEDCGNRFKMRQRYRRQKK